MGRHPTGIDRVCLAYLQHFAPHAQAVVQHRRFRGILDRNASGALFELLSHPGGGFRKQLLSGIFRHFRGSQNDGAGRLYLNIGHTGLDSPGLTKWVEKSGVRPVYFAHDLIPISHPEFCRAGESERHRRRMRTVLTTGCGVIGNSKATLDELRCFARAEKLSEVPAIAAWLGISRFAGPAKPETTGRPTFVVLGTIEARKNHLLLLNIWLRLVARLGPKAPRLLVIGQRGWEAELAFRILDSGNLREHVVELNDCSDERIIHHLSSACALLFPSHAEGYGLPLVEALDLGVPVIASDLPVFREIGQGVPDLLPLSDAAAWEADILEYARPESPARAAQLQRMSGFSAPEWKSHFRVVESWLPSVTEKAGP